MHCYLRLKYKLKVKIYFKCHRHNVGCVSLIPSIADRHNGTSHARQLSIYVLCKQCIVSTNKGFFSQNSICFRCYMNRYCIWAKWFFEINFLPTRLKCNPPAFQSHSIELSTEHWNTFVCTTFESEFNLVIYYWIGTFQEFMFVKLASYVYLLIMDRFDLTTPLARI